MPTELHLAVYAFALQLLLQGAKRLVDVIVADGNQHANLAFYFAAIIGLPMDRGLAELCQDYDWPRYLSGGKFPQGWAAVSPFTREACQETRICLGRTKRVTRGHEAGRR